MKDFEKKLKEVETTKKSPKDHLAFCVRMTKRTFDYIERGTNRLTKSVIVNQDALEDIRLGKAMLKYIAKVEEQLLNE